MSDTATARVDAFRPMAPKPPPNPLSTFQGWPEWLALFPHPAESNTEAIGFGELERNTTDWLTPIREELDKLKRLPENWDSYGASAPESGTTLRAAEIVELLWEWAQKPQRIAPSSEGGIILWLRTDKKLLSVEFLNSGETIIEVRGGRDEEISDWEIPSHDPDEIASRLAALGCGVEAGSSSENVSWLEEG